MTHGWKAKGHCVIKAGSRYQSETELLYKRSGVVERALSGRCGRFQTWTSGEVKGQGRVTDSPKPWTTTVFTPSCSYTATEVRTRFSSAVCGNDWAVFMDVFSRARARVYSTLRKHFHICQKLSVHVHVRIQSEAGMRVWLRAHNNYHSWEVCSKSPLCEVGALRYVDFVINAKLF